MTRPQTKSSGADLDLRRAPVRLPGGRSLQCRQGAGPRFSSGAGLAQCCEAAHARGPARAAGHHRFVDVLLNQLHAHFSAVAEVRTKVRRQGDRGRRAFAQVRGRARDREPAGSGAALSNRAPGGQPCRAHLAWEWIDRTETTGAGHRRRFASPAGYAPARWASSSPIPTTIASRSPTGKAVTSEP